MAGPILVHPKRPSVTGMTVNADGDRLNVTLSESCTGNDGLSITPSGGASSLTYDSGTGATRAYALGRIIAAGESITGSHLGLSIKNAGGRTLRKFSGFEVTNLSESGAAVGDAEPELQIDDPVFVLSGQAINYQTTLLAGTSATYSAIGLPTGASIEEETGAVTGTLTTPGTWRMVITAVNDQGAFTIYVPVHVYVSATTIDDAWLASEGGPVYYLDQAGEHYILDVDVTTNGTAFVVNANNVSLDLNSHTITYGNATPITINNASFETVDAGDADLADGWDFSGAPNAVRWEGDWLNNELNDGDYSLKFNDTSETEEVVNESTVTLEANTTYAISASFDYGNKANNPGVEGYVELTGDGLTTVRVSWSGKNNRGIQYVETVFTTGETAGPYTLTAGIVGHASGTLPFYIDDIRIRRTRVMGVAVAPNNTTEFPDVTSFADCNDAIVTNGSIIQGQDQGSWSPAINRRRGTGHSLHGLTCTVGGHNCHVLWLQGGGTAKPTSVVNCTLTSNSTTITSRDHGDGAIIKSWSTIPLLIFDNTLSNGPHSGIALVSNGPNIVARNTIALKSIYTNAFAIVCSDEESEVYGNVINAGTGVFNSRGIWGARHVHHNSVEVQTLQNNREYVGSDNIELGAKYGYQVQDWDGTLLTEHNTITIKGSFGGHPFRLNPSPPGGLHTIRNNHFIGDITANHWPLGEVTQHPSCLYYTSMDGDFLVFEDNEITTNVPILYTEGSCPNLLFKRTTITYIDDGIDGDYPWLIGLMGPPLEAHVIWEDTDFGDAGSKTWFDDGARHTPDVSYMLRTERCSSTVRNNITATLSDGSPIANTAVVVTDNQSNEVFNGTTDGNGVIEFVATDYKWTNGVRAEYQPHTFTITGYDPKQETVDDADRTPTVTMTPE